MKVKRKRIEEQIQKIQKKIEALPEGKLICSGKGSKCKWFRGDGHTKEYIQKKDRSLAEKLAVKKYFSLLKEDFEHEKRAIDAYLKVFTNYESKAEKLLTDSSEFQNLLSPYFAPLSEELDNWMKSPYEHNLKYPEHLVHKISSNEYVRSKSEAIIGKVLKANKIPYRYESPLVLDDITLHPDFTIRHPKTGEYFYWEHFGLLEKTEYVKGMYFKMQLYTSNKIFPGISLITTYETGEKPLTFEMVEMLVRYYFL